MNGTCTREHDGQTVGAAAAALFDPSAPNFCALLTGVDNTFSAFPPPKAVCSALTEASILNTTQCRLDFCAAGVEGFEDFMSAMFGWVRAHLVYVTVVLAALLLLEIGQLVMSIAALCAACKHDNGNSGGDENPMGDRARLLGKSRRPRRRNRTGVYSDDASDSSERSEMLDIRTPSMADTSRSDIEAERAIFRKKIQAQLSAAQAP